MVRWCCDIIIPLIGAVLLGVGLVLLFATDENEFADVQSFVVGGGVLLGMALINLVAYFVIKWTSQNVKTYPEQRRIIWSIPLALYAAFFTIFVAWPLGWMLQIFLYYTIGLFLSDNKRRNLAGFVWRSAANLFSVWLSPFWHVNVKRRPAGGIPSQTIVMANHLSFSDGFVLSSAMYPYDAKFAATSWVFKIPFGGWMSRRSGDLPIKLNRIEDPDAYLGRRYKPDKEVTQRTMQTARQYATDGVRMAMFPEGSVSPNGNLKVFRDGFFKVAIETGCSITPVGMWGNQSMWLPQTSRPQPGYAEVAIGDAIPVSKSDSVEDVKQKVQDAIEELKASLPLFQKTHSLIRQMEVV